MVWVLGFFALLLIAGLLERGRITGFGEYLLAGRRQSAGVVGFSLMASCIGGSATVGVVGMAYTAGLPAWWWLGSGALGLIVLGCFLARKLRALEANTLPDLAGALLGQRSRIAVALVIAPAWIGITAAQFVTIAKILHPMLGVDQTAILAACALTVTAYAAMGGQISVLKTDVWQFLFLSAALIATAAYLYATHPVWPTRAQLTLVNAHFPPGRLLYFLVIMGGSYVVCPMLFSRLFTARSPQTARRATLGSAIGLALMSLVIAAIGLWAAQVLPGVADPDKVLTGAVAGLLPTPLRVLLVLGLLAAVTSSADSCLITVGSIVEHDLLRRRRVKGIRFHVLLCGLLSAFLAWGRPDIIGLLLQATTIFTCGVVAPVAVALLAWPRWTVHPAWGTAAVVLGGSMGVWSCASGQDLAALAGVLASGLLTLVGTLRGQRRSTAA
ncbi:MAG: solute:Na+ symporter, family [Desulfovibrionales bacterium]|nr:solute:Na+ symporter, family [Desulfovibrionales bacterium]